MSKTTKVIAALGVVAGLGVAALPAFTYAAEVAGQVEVQVDVDPAIAMTIAGNRDAAAANPRNAKDGVSVYDSSTKVGAYDAASAYRVGVAYDEDVLQTSVSGVRILPNAVINGGTGTGEAETFASTINVYTNNATYNLSVEDADSNTDLETTGRTALIPTGTTSTFSLSAGDAAWGFVIDTPSSDNSGYKPMSANGTATPIKSSQASSTTLTTIYYGVATDEAQAQGQYTDTIIYTATAN